MMAVFSMSSSGDGVEAAIIAAGPPQTVCLGNHVEWRRPWRVGAANNPRSFQRAELGLGNFQFIRIQAASLGKNRATSGFNKMADAVAWPRSAFAVADNTGKRRQEGAHRQNNVRNRRGKLGRGGGDCVAHWL